MRPPRTFTSGPAPGAIDRLQQEIAEEMAATLGRCARAFEQALNAFLAHAAAPAAGERDATRHEELLANAGEALWAFVVQREACGLGNTEAVLRDYGVPAAVRLSMGVVRRV